MTATSTLSQQPPPPLLHTPASPSRPRPTTWHHRLGHPSSVTLDILRNNSSISCNKPAHTLCHSCQLGKHVRLPFSNSSSRSSVAFELVHCDVWTSPVASISGYRYYLVILDDYTHYCWMFPLARKSDVLSHVTSFCAFVQTQFGLPIKSFQADNGTEFVNNSLTSLFSSLGIHLRLSCPYTSPQNGKAERMLRTLNNISRTLLIHAHMPSPYWAEALATATYLLNRRPCTSTQNSTPYELLYHKAPDYAHLRIFGCLCYPNLSATAPHKLAPRSTACVFLGYPSSHKGYHCLDLSTQRIIISRHVVFDETCFPFAMHTPFSPSSIDFLLAGRAAPVPCTVAAAHLPAEAPSLVDVERPRSSPRLPDEEPPEDPAILFRGPVLFNPSASPNSTPAVASSPPGGSDGPPSGPTATAGLPLAATDVALPPIHSNIQLVYSHRPRLAATTAAIGFAGPAAPPAPAPPAPAQVPTPAPAPSRPVTQSQTGSLRQVDRLNLSATTSVISPLPANYRSGLADPN